MTNHKLRFGWPSVLYAVVPCSSIVQWRTGELAFVHAATFHRGSSLSCLYCLAAVPRHLCTCRSVCMIRYPYKCTKPVTSVYFGRCSPWKPNRTIRGLLWQPHTYPQATRPLVATLSNCVLITSTIQGHTHDVETHQVGSSMNAVALPVCSGPHRGPPLHGCPQKLRSLSSELAKQSYKVAEEPALEAVTEQGERLWLLIRLRHQPWVHRSRQPTRLTQLGAVQLSICPVQPKPTRVGHDCPTADGLQLAPGPEEGMDGQVGAEEGDAGVGEGRRDAGRRSAREGERRIVDGLKSRCRRWGCKRCTGSRRRRRSRRWHRRRRQSRGERHVCQLRRRWHVLVTYRMWCQWRITRHQNMLLVRYEPSFTMYLCTFMIDFHAYIDANLNRSFPAFVCLSTYKL